MNVVKSLKLLVIFLLAYSSLALSGNAVIVHPDNNADISQSDVEKLYLAKKKKFSDGQSAIPLNHKEGADIRVAFDDAVVGKSPTQMKSYWSKLVFTGKETPLKEVDSDAEMIELVGKNPSVIGYVDEASVTDGVKVLFTF